MTLLARLRLMPHRQARVLAFALLLAAVGLLLSLAMSVQLPARSGLRAAVATAEDGLVRLRELAARREALRAEVEALRRAPALQNVFLATGSEAQATAALQERVKRAVASGGARLVSLEALPVRSQDGGPQLGLRVRLVADTGALQRLVCALEVGRPFVFLDALYVRSRTAAAAPGEPSLDIRFDVWGFLAPAGS
ncbi:MAG: hypothetical protein FJX68_02615 [Alphaproteobacteria bacterium]|nr:hypothetical protein [Alphaproteobacteria bacterium]